MNFFLDHIDGPNCFYEEDDDIPEEVYQKFKKMLEEHAIKVNIPYAYSKREESAEREKLSTLTK